MRNKSLSVYYFIYWLLALLPIYQDSPLSGVLGAAGYTLILPVALILYLAIIFMVQKGHIKREVETKGLFKLGEWLLVISFVGLIVWVMLGNSLTFVGEFLPIKAIKVWLQYIAFPIYAYDMIFCIKRLRGPEQIFKPVIVALVILTIIAILERAQIPYAFQNLHFFGIFPYWRIRLLTVESSYTALLIYVYAGLSIYYGYGYKKRIVLATSLICYGLLVATSGSRSMIVSIALALICYVLIAAKKLNRRTIVGLLFVAILFVVFAEIMLPRIVAISESDISNYTSIATRLYTGLLGLMIGIVFPFGVGGAAYLGVFQHALSNYLSIFDKLPIRLNTLEVAYLASSQTDVALTVKSGILHYNMYWGVVGSIYLIRIFKKLSDRLNSRYIPNNEIIRAVFWGAILLLIISSNFQFEFWMMYAVLYGVVFFADTHQD